MRQSALGNALSTILAPLWSLAFREQHESPAITIADGMELRVQTAHPFFRRLAAVRGPSDVLASIMICPGWGPSPAKAVRILSNTPGGLQRMKRL
jgi:hypothetical protein